MTSRGRFDRDLGDKVAEFAMRRDSVNLCDLLDNAFDYASASTKSGQHVMDKQDGKNAQLMTIAYMNVDYESLIADNTVLEPRSKERKM